MKHKIIDTATELAQKYGLNAFSYQDISQAVGITKASIHHHFPTKSDLSYAILELYINNFFASLAEYENSNLTPLELLTTYVDAFKNVAIQNNKLCLCFMYASEYLTLNDSTQGLVKKFYLDNEMWLTKYLGQYLNMHEVDIGGLSRVVFSTLQGLLVRNRIFIDYTDFDNILKYINLFKR